MGDTNYRNHAPALVLLSGGLDSATCLALAQHEQAQAAIEPNADDPNSTPAEAAGGVHAISFDYNQRHRCELNAAHTIATQLNADRHITVPVNLSAFGHSALTDTTINVPKHDPSADLPQGIPITYVPARNLVFLSLAAAYAETINARRILIGVNAIDYSGYPDCRPEFIQAFKHAANLATKRGIEGNPIDIETPLINMSKADIIRLGMSLNLDYAHTVSCYDPDDQGRACGACDACILRARGFAQAHTPDPTRYKPGVTPPTPTHA